MSYTSTIQKSSPQSSLDSVIDKKLFKDSKDRSSLSQDDFMSLFVTELKNQDPTKPMDTGQMASQLAQFNQVDLMYKNNQTMEKMLLAAQDQARVQSIGYIGQTIRYEGNKALLTDGKLEPFEYELSKNSDKLKISIFNEKGILVKEIENTQSKAGKNILDWDGTDKNGTKVSDGYYKVVVEALDKKGDLIDVKYLTTDKVSGVRYEKGETKLTLKNGTEIALDKLTKIGY